VSEIYKNRIPGEIDLYTINTMPENPNFLDKFKGAAKTVLNKINGKNLPIQINITPYIPSERLSYFTDLSKKLKNIYHGAYNIKERSINFVKRHKVAVAIGCGVILFGAYAALGCWDGLGYSLRQSGSIPEVDVYELRLNPILHPIPNLLGGGVKKYSLLRESMGAVLNDVRLRSISSVLGHSLICLALIGISKEVYRRIKRK